MQVDERAEARVVRETQLDNSQVFKIHVALQLYDKGKTRHSL